MERDNGVMSDYWRFISYEEHTAAYNMAADEAILDAHFEGISPPTLRIYGFNPPALSLGANQKLPAEVLQQVSSNGFDIVRRPSGGRAVLHLGDLTYSFVGTAANDKNHIDRKQFLFPSVSGAYRQICQGLILAFRRLGLELEFGVENAGISARHPDCFASTTIGDLHVNGLKIIGSAQLRRKTAVLQHGTIILKQNQDAICQLLQPIGLESSSVARHANLYDLLGYELPKQKLEAIILQGFQEAFDVNFKQEKLLQFEEERLTGLSKAVKFVHAS